ncbi:MAG: sensor histidine kinase [Clostridiaceae bacterium]
MNISALDIITTIFQSVIMAWLINNTVSKENKLTKRKMIVFISINTLIIILCTTGLIELVLGDILVVIGIMSISMLFFPKEKRYSLLGFGIIYSIIIMCAFILIGIYKTVISNINLTISMNTQMFLFIYLPGWIVYTLVYILRKYILNFISYLKTTKDLMIIIMLINYSIIVLEIIRVYVQDGNMSIMYKSMLFCLCFILILFLIFYITIISENAKEIEKLNETLNEKIIELRKIKHDYGSEISSLYGLYQLGNIDKLGELMKGIIDRNGSINTAVSANLNATPIIASILNDLTNKGINTIVSDNGNYENLNLSDNELIKLVSNIIKNSVDALKDSKNPLIKYSSFNSYQSLTIIISNNGPEIPNGIKNKIFQTGFSTKENLNENRGYGLSIVKDILNKNNGDIQVESNGNWTRFKIEIAREEI